MSVARIAAAGSSSGPDPEQGRSRRRVERTLIGAFVAVVVGLVVIDLSILLALHRPLRELARMGTEHAQAVAIGTRIRGQLSHLRGTVVESIEGGPRASGAPEAFHVLYATVAELEPLADTDTERRDLAALRSAIGDCAVVSGQIERLVAGGDRPAARRELEEFLRLSAAANRGADEMVAFNAGQVQQSAMHVHRGLVVAIAAASIMTALAIAAAMVLLRNARSALAGHSALLERHAAEMGAFASRAAHELRNPLQSLTLALARLRPDPAQARILAQAGASARRLRETIEEILEFSRAGAVPVPGAYCDVAEVVDQVAEELGPRASEASVELERHVAPGLVAAIAPGHLRIVLANLVGNAIKYAVNDAPHVAVGARREGSAVEIAVRDNGPGIPEHALPHVFEPFYRASSKPGGYGLGLATVKQLVEAHGGSIAIASGRREGTAVRVRLPIPPQAEPAPLHAAQQR
jgi:signal transduction histidine kinase